jgi:hypothetical protein
MQCFKQNRDCVKLRQKKTSQRRRAHARAPALRRAAPSLRLASQAGPSSHSASQVGPSPNPVSQVGPSRNSESQAGPSSDPDSSQLIKFASQFLIAGPPGIRESAAVLFWRAESARAAAAARAAKAYSNLVEKTCRQEIEHALQQVDPDEHKKIKETYCVIMGNMTEEDWPVVSAGCGQ